MSKILGCAILMAVLGVLQTNAVVVSEEEQMALEISGVMLPPKKLTNQIREHLKAVRKFHPEMERIVHRPKWIPGELFVASIDDFIIQRLNSSRYGPVKTAVKVENADSSAKTTFHIIFEKPYHPARLVERVRSELGIQEVEGNLISGDGNDISYHPTAPTYFTYTFQMGWGNCAVECTYRRFWEFTVAPSVETLTVKLEKEYGSDLGNQEFVQP